MIKNLKEDLIKEWQTIAPTRKAFSEWSAREVAGYNLRWGSHWWDINSTERFWIEVRTLMQMAEEAQ